MTTPATDTDTQVQEFQQRVASTLSPVFNKKGNVMRNESSLLPEGARNAAALRKFYRDEKGLSNAEARKAVSAAMSGDTGKLSNIMAVAFLQDSTQSGYYGTRISESKDGKTRQIVLEKHISPTEDAAQKARKAKAATDKAIADIRSKAADAMRSKGLTDEEIEAAFAE